MEGGVYPGSWLQSVHSTVWGECESRSKNCSLSGIPIQKAENELKVGHGEGWPIQLQGPPQVSLLPMRFHLLEVPQPFWVEPQSGDLSFKHRSIYVKHLPFKRNTGLADRYYTLCAWHWLSPTSMKQNETIEANALWAMLRYEKHTGSH